MPQDIKKNQKQIAIELRSKGLSYKEIQKEIAVPLSTLSLWLKQVQLIGAHVKRLKEKRSSVARKNSMARAVAVRSERRRIEEESVSRIKAITERELWLMGLALYWKEHSVSKHGTEHDTKNNPPVQFTSADPDIVSFILRWLYQVGKIKKRELLIDVFLREEDVYRKDDIVRYWSKIAHINIAELHRVYVQKSRRERASAVARRNRLRSPYGFVRIRVVSSSLMATQISGWIKGLKHVLLRG